jgi:anti-sigma factor RsiW
MKTALATAVFITLMACPVDAQSFSHDYGTGNVLAFKPEQTIAPYAFAPRQATNSYNVYASDHVRPVEMRATESAQLVQWVSDRLRHPVKVPDLTTSGYRLMGGDWSPRPMVLLRCLCMMTITARSTGSANAPDEYRSEWTDDATIKRWGCGFHMG